MGRRPLTRAGARALVGGLALLLGSDAAAAQPRDLDDLAGRAIRQRVDGALAVLGIAAVPSETASTLVLDTEGGRRGRLDFRAAQLGAGFTVSDDVPLYLEGFIAYNRYDPVFVLGGGQERSLLPAKWTSVSATGGVGWDFRLSDTLILRPIVNPSLGRVQSDLSIAAQVLAERLCVEGEFLRNGGVTAGGYGGALMLEYNRRWDNDVEADLTLRHTHIRLEPIAGDRAVA